MTKIKLEGDAELLFNETIRNNKRKSNFGRKIL